MTERAPSPLQTWLPVGIGLLALYLPSFVEFSQTLWQTEEQWHAPLILLVSTWYFWRLRACWLPDAATAQRPAPAAGWPLLLLGLLLYVAGRTQEVLLFEIGSMMPILAGTLLIQRGWLAVRILWFPLLFLVFMIPTQGALVYTLTGPLKQSVSIVAENLLYAAGYPIGRSGVVLTIGQYQLLVADACSGLNTMFSLSALGLFYIYRMGHPSLWRNIVLFACVLPTAYLANVARVAILTLVTYRFGDAAGQSFVHNFAGMILFLVALLILFAIDGLLSLFPQRRRRPAAP